MDKRHRGAQTAWRVLELLQLFVRSEDHMTLAELSRRTGLNRTTTYRLLSVLEEQSFVTREPGSRRYLAGSGLISLSAIILSRIDVRVAARPTMARIAEYTTETVTLHVRHMTNRICIDGIEARQAIRRAVQLGETLPLYAGPSGKVILAYMDPDEIEGILHLAAEAGHNVMAVRQQLKAIRDRGYMASVGDRTPDVGGLSMPLFDANGIAGSLTVAGPGDRWNQKAMEAAAGYALVQCQALSASLGSSGNRMFNRAMNI